MLYVAPWVHLRSLLLVMILHEMNGLSKSKASKGEGGHSHKLNLRLKLDPVLTHCSWHKTSSPFSAAPCCGLSCDIKEESTWDPGYLVGSKFTFLLQSSINNSSVERSSPGLYPHCSYERGFQQQRRLLLFLQVRFWLFLFWRLVPNTCFSLRDVFSKRHVLLIFLF